MPHCCVSQAGLEKLLFQTKKTNTFLVVTLLRLQPLCQGRLQQNRCPLGGSQDFRCAFLPVQATSHSSPVPCRVGRGSSPDLGTVGGKGVPHMLGHSSRAWAAQSLGSPHGRRAPRMGLCLCLFSAMLR